jgi:hypothetical protein
MWGRKHHESARSATTAPVCVPISLSLFLSFFPNKKKTITVHVLLVGLQYTPYTNYKHTAENIKDVVRRCLSSI